MKEYQNLNIIEAVDKKGSVWKVEILKAGLSKNGNYYSEELLTASVSKKIFEGVRSFARTDMEHLKNTNESVKNVVGWFDEVVYSPEEKRVEGNFHITRDALWLREKALSAFESGKNDLFGFSIVGVVKAVTGIMDGKKINHIQEIIQILSIDPVVNPSAGGGIITIIESELNHKENIMKDQIAALLKTDYTDKLNGKNPENMTDEELINILEEILSEVKTGTSSEANCIKDKIESFKQEIELLNSSFSKLKISESAMKMNENLLKSNLPEPVKQKIKKFCEGKILSESEITEIINSEQDVYAKVFESMKTNQFEKISVGRDDRDKMQSALDNFFFIGERLNDDEKKSESQFNNAFRSIKEAYIQMTGDNSVTGRISKSNRLSEAIDSSTFTNALANSITKKMIRDYNMMNLDSWKNFVDIIPVSDFKQQERVRIGGYGNLSAVAQGSSYPAITSPTDEKVTYTLSKYGGVETITLEAIRNDDVYALRKIPTRLARAAAQTLHEHIFNWFKNNSVLYDGKQFFHNDHNNLGSAALDSTSLGNARLAMKKQTQSGSNKALGLRARYLIVPSDLEITAYDLTRLGYGQNNNIPTFLQEQKIIPIVVDYWPDGNNWYLVADPKDAVCIELGFLDGRQEPELIISDEPSNGSLFTNDTITYKIRHIYSSAVLDYRAAFGAVVA
jgi:hypothetical protein